MKLDIKKWNEVRKQYETEVKATKTLIRHTSRPFKVWGKTGEIHQDGYYKGQPKYGFVDSSTLGKYGTSDEYYSLKDAKAILTELYALRAACRNKQHCAAISKEEALARLPLYALENEENLALAS